MKAQPILLLALAVLLAFPVLVTAAERQWPVALAPAEEHDILPELAEEAVVMREQQPERWNRYISEIERRVRQVNAFNSSPRGRMMHVPARLHLNDDWPGDDPLPLCLITEVLCQENPDPHLYVRFYGKGPYWSALVNSYDPRRAEALFYCRHHFKHDRDADSDYGYYLGNADWYAGKIHLLLDEREPLDNHALLYGLIKEGSQQQLPNECRIRAYDYILPQVLSERPLPKEHRWWMILLLLKPEEATTDLITAYNETLPWSLVHTLSLHTRPNPVAAKLVRGHLAHPSPREKLVLGEDLTALRGLLLQLDPEEEMPRVAAEIDHRLAERGNVSYRTLPRDEWHDRTLDNLVRSVMRCEGEAAEEIVAQATISPAYRWSSERRDYFEFLVKRDSAQLPAVIRALDAERRSVPEPDVYYLSALKYNLPAERVKQLLAAAGVTEKE